MHFPRHDSHWIDALASFRRQASPEDTLYAPNEFLEYHAQTYPLNYLTHNRFPEADWVLFHRAWEKSLIPKALQLLQSDYHVTWENPVFILYMRLSRWKLPEWPRFPRRRLPTLQDQRHLVHHDPGIASTDPLQNTALVVTTYNRPWALKRSLPLFLALGVPVLVVNDGSDSQWSTEYQEIYRQNQGDRLVVLELPSNRGLACAQNIGISHWLAHPRIEWISYFQDDMEVDPGILNALAPLRHPVDRPILSGYPSPEHPTIRIETLMGREVHHRHSNSGQHYDAHRSYWERVMPIPSITLGAPKKSRSSDEDWWIISWSPQSIVKQGGTISCLPGLLRDFGLGSELSTWGNPGQ